jgi:hypothetical protein
MRIGRISSRSGAWVARGAGSALTAAMRPPQGAIGSAKWWSRSLLTSAGPSDGSIRWTTASGGRAAKAAPTASSVSAGRRRSSVKAISRRGPRRRGQERGAEGQAAIEVRAVAEGQRGPEGVQARQRALDVEQLAEQPAGVAARHDQLDPGVALVGQVAAHDRELGRQPIGADALRAVEHEHHRRPLGRRGELGRDPYLDGARRVGVRRRPRSRAPWRRSGWARASSRPGRRRGSRRASQRARRPPSARRGSRRTGRRRRPPSRLARARRAARRRAARSGTNDRGGSRSAPRPRRPRRPGRRRG